MNSATSSVSPPTRHPADRVNSSGTNRLTDPLLAPVYHAGGNLADITLADEH